MKTAQRWFQREVFMSKLIGRSFFLMAGLLVLANSGCTNIKTFAINDGLPISGLTHLSGPAVALFPVEETLPQEPEAAAAFPDDATAVKKVTFKTDPIYLFKTDPTYLGKGLRMFATAYIVIPQFRHEEFHADMPRTDMIRTVARSRLKNLGIPATYQAKGGDAQFMMLPEDRLGITMRLRKIDVNSSFTSVLPLIIVNTFYFNDDVAHVVLDCQLWQSGTSASLWEGTGEGRFTTDDFEKMKKSVGWQHKRGTVTIIGLNESFMDYWHEGWQYKNVVWEAVSIAVDQCITKSGLVETRAKLSNQRYARLMTNGSKQVTDGNTVKALDTYGQAYDSALMSEQSLDAVKAMAKLIKAIKAIPTNQVVPKEARRFNVQAENAIREMKFKEAADLYGEALNVALWWPGVHFNRALVLGETGEYGEAKREMKLYLQLVPDAPNARVAQDKIYNWERLESK